jgi:hypothetical protein
MTAYAHLLASAAKRHTVLEYMPVVERIISAWQ